MNACPTVALTLEVGMLATDALFDNQTRTIRCGYPHSIELQVIFHFKPTEEKTAFSKTYAI